ncbi:MAG: UDP-N-acetylglucosamine pyrophosphorylase [Clostridia bacterium]|nr:UDP-N-acetylglucosamine pyrophosphorylase [Clostridia bacterium]
MRGDTALNKSVLTKELFFDVPKYLQELFERCKYAWQIIPEIKDVAAELLKQGIRGYSLIADGVLVGENVSIAPTATIIGPCIIGEGSELRPGAYIRGNVIIGKNCVVGNSCELKNCILLDFCQVPHYNYIGDSVLGNHCHMGAGAICSNLKADGTSVVVRAECSYDTALRKMGAIVADYADVGCGCVLNPGTVIGRGTSVYPLTSLRGVIASGCIVKSADNIIVRRQ